MKRGRRERTGGMGEMIWGMRVEEKEKEKGQGIWGKAGWRKGGGIRRMGERISGQGRDKGDGEGTRGKGERRMIERVKGIRGMREEEEIKGMGKA